MFTQSGGVWTQQGSKLVGTGAVGASVLQGQSVALSSDGNTLIAGGPYDNSRVGAAWIFTRTNGLWVQQGTKLVGTGSTGAMEQAYSVSLSADGNTAALGAPVGTSDIGGTWVFTRSNGVWNQQGLKLVAGNASTLDLQGSSVSLSADGTILIVGAPGDANETGAVWVFTQSGGVWTQLGTKLVGTGTYQGGSLFGASVALAAGGSSLIVGATQYGSGETFVFVPGQPLPVVTAIAPSSGPAAGGTSVTITGDYFTAGSTVSFGSIAATSVTFNSTTSLTATSPAGSAGTVDVIVTTSGGTSATSAADKFTYPPAHHDFNGDGVSDILWRDTAGDTTIWFMNGGSVASGVSLGNVPTVWSVAGTGDFNGDGVSDILWRDTSGDTTIWFGSLASGHVPSTQSVGNIPQPWSVAGVGDFNGDGDADILWRDPSGDTTVWFLRNGQLSSVASLGQIPSAWTVAGIGDFNGDGKSDILWRDASGDTTIWFMSGSGVTSSTSLGNIPTIWSVVGVADFNGDHISDILWRDASGDTTIWFMNTGVSSSTGLGNIPTAWSVAETGDFNGDGQADILWRDTSGDTTIWFLNSGQIMSTTGLGNVPPAWSVQGSNAE